MMPIPTFSISSSLWWQAWRSIDDFNDLNRSAQLSEGTQHLIRAYSSVRWVTFAIGLAALIAFPVAVSLAGFMGWFFPGKHLHLCTSI